MNDLESIPPSPSPTTFQQPSSLLLTVKDVAQQLKCSPRTVYRLADGGLLPKPRKMGAMVRWSAIEIQDWIAKGCKPVRR